MIGQKAHHLDEILTRLVITEKSFSGIFSNNAALSIVHVDDGFFWPTKGTGGLQHHKFLIFDGKQHPKNIWFREC